LPIVADSLAGRLEVITLLPLAQCELAARPGDLLDRLFDGAGLPGAENPVIGDALMDRVLQGGYPEALRRTQPSRRQAWLDAAQECGVELDPKAAARFAGAFRLDPARIREAFDNAADGTESALVKAAVRLSVERIPHGNAVEPARSFDDIVLVDTTRESLRRLIFFTQNRDRIAEERGLEHRYKLRRGPVVLFSGRSGTGKTLAAEIVAGTLQRPLHVVDLARLVSKYVGETEKNIDEVLACGEQAGAVLFFDEADSLFSQRTEVATPTTASPTWKWATCCSGSKPTTAW
jgi:hypothetical protein